MKFLIAIAFICAFAFSTVQSVECNDTDNAAEIESCAAAGSACDVAMDLCDTVGVAVSACKDSAVAAFDTLVATVTACECPAMTCEASGAAFVAMSFMAVFAGLLV